MAAQWRPAIYGMDSNEPAIYVAVATASPEDTGSLTRQARRWHEHDEHRLPRWTGMATAAV